MNAYVGYNLSIRLKINTIDVLIVNYYIFNPYKYPLIQRKMSTAWTASNKITIIGLIAIS